MLHIIRIIGVHLESFTEGLSLKISKRYRGEGQEWRWIISICIKQKDCRDVARNGNLNLLGGGA